MSLLQRFSLYSFLVMIILALLLGTLISRGLMVHILDVYKTDMARFLQSEGEENILPEALRAPITDDMRYVAIGQALHVLRQTMPLYRLKIYNRQGVTIWSTDRALIGRWEDHDKEGFARAIAGTTSVYLIKTRERGVAGGTDAFEMFVPLRDSQGAVYGVIEMYQGLAQIEQFVRTAQVRAWAIVIMTFLVLYAILYKIVAEASRLIQRQHQELVETRRARYTETIEALVSAIDAKDEYTRGHSMRVAKVAMAIGRAMGLSREDLETLYYGALLHDVGKIGIRDAVLGKPGRLTPEEMEEIRRHPAIGVNMFKRLESVPREVLQAIGAHHERPDRRGYPTGAWGDDVHLFARIVAVADCYDAMRSDRPYRKARTREDTLDEIRRYTGEQFDPEVVRALFQVVDSLEADIYSNPAFNSDLHSA